MNQISCEAFNELEDEVKQEFYEDVQSAIKDINECASTLETGADAAVIDRMFRALHTVKGNCKMVFLEEFVTSSHKLEDLFSGIRSGEIDYQDIYGKFAVTAVNAIDIQLKTLVETGSADADTLKKLEDIIDHIEVAPVEDRPHLAEKAIIAIQDGHFKLDLVALDEGHGRAFSFLDATDFEFFEFISDKKALIDPSHQAFIDICEPLAMKLNAKLGQSIDEQQLRTAVIFVAFSRALASDSLATMLEVEQVFFVSGLLNRMAGWSTAAEIALQMIEKHDGTGAPLGIEGDKIMPAAQALGLATEFALIVLQSKTKGYKQSLFSAVKLINAQKDSRYKSRLIERFNDVIKSEYLTTQMW
ncbi:hypothetical protein FLL45_00800 [Aliikangiella marina]|uniref:HPt domain-containing protein n=1 Tax=Aliikangiella marina TaxID=1712262 RepID=A0A545TH21_9GAMM|nr:Hpt domain-containing protein [Aliikangiella marina]TQV76534.1 hypothetical protein FLL45_00800 [Aliikangiella marina]